MAVPFSKPQYHSRSSASVPPMPVRDQWRRPLNRPPPRRPRASSPVEQLLVFNLRGLGFASRIALYTFYEAWRLIQGLIGPERENNEVNGSDSAV